MTEAQAMKLVDVYQGLLLEQQKLVSLLVKAVEVMESMAKGIK